MRLEVLITLLEKKAKKRKEGIFILKKSVFQHDKTGIKFIEHRIFVFDQVFYAPLKQAFGQP